MGVATQEDFPSLGGGSKSNVRSKMLRGGTGGRPAMAAYTPAALSRGSAASVASRPTMADLSGSTYFTSSYASAAPTQSRPPNMSAGSFPRSEDPGLSVAVERSLLRKAVPNPTSPLKPSEKGSTTTVRVTFLRSEELLLLEARSGVRRLHHSRQRHALRLILHHVPRILARETFPHSAVAVVEVLSESKVGSPHHQKAVPIPMVLPKPSERGSATPRTTFLRSEEVSRLPEV